MSINPICRTLFLIDTIHVTSLLAKTELFKERMYMEPDVGL